MSEIVLKDVKFAYEKNLVLENINFESNCDDFLAIIGPNGGGKSTLLKLILGLLKPKSGSIKILGKDPQKQKNILAYVPQNINAHQIFPITCLEVTLMGRLKAKGLGIYSKNDYKKAYEAMEKVGVRHLADENISNLSGGQRQRVFIARALCSDAKIIVLDEPTASIDTDGQIQIYKLLKKLNEHLGIIVVSHDINMAVTFANKVAHVNKNLFLHHIHKNEAKQKFIEGINLKSGHICPVEIISQAPCEHHEHHKES